MSHDSDTPPPFARLCTEHSGFHQRIKDLEGRAINAGEERRSMSKELVAIRVNMAKWAGAIAVLLVVVQVTTAVILKVLP